MIAAALLALALIAGGAWNLSRESASGSPGSPGPAGVTSAAPDASSPGTMSGPSLPTPLPRATGDFPSSPPASPGLPASSPAAMGQAQVLLQLTEIETRWSEANFRANRMALMRILADDYRSIGAGPASKDEYLQQLKPDTHVQTWALRNIRLQTLQGDRATISGDMEVVYPRGTRRWHFVDAFVHRDGRWQATSSQTLEVRK